MRGLRARWRHLAEPAIEEYYREHPPWRPHTLRYKTKPQELRVKGILIHGIDTPDWEAIEHTDQDLFIWEIRRSDASPESPLLLRQSCAVLKDRVDNTVPPHAIVGYPDGMKQWARTSFEIVGGELPRGKDPQEHWCEHPGCAEWGAYGFGPLGIDGLNKPKKWFCAKHRPTQGELF